MKNSLRVDEDPLKVHRVVYEILCLADSCNHSYVGMTTTKLSKRLFVRSHRVLRRPLLLQATTIIDHDQNRHCLPFKEALHIMKLKPSLNIMQENLIFPTSIRRQCPTRNKNQVAAGIPVRAPEPERVPEPMAANQHQRILQQATTNQDQDLPTSAVRRSSRIRHHVAAQQPIGIQDSW